MSPQTEPIWVTAMRRLKGEDYRLWAYLVWRQGNNGSAWPHQQSIAHDLSLSVAGVRKISRRLERAGWLHIHKPDLSGRKHGLMYTVLCPEEGSTPVYPSGHEKGTCPSTLPAEKGLRSFTPKGSTPVEPMNKYKINTTNLVNTNNGLLGRSTQEVLGLDLANLPVEIAQRTERLWEALLREFPVRTPRTTQTFGRAVTYMVVHAQAGEPEALAWLSDAHEWIRESKQRGVNNPPGNWVYLVGKHTGFSEKGRQKRKAARMVESANRQRGP